MSKLSGKLRIVETAVWEKEHLDLCGQPLSRSILRAAVTWPTGY